MAFKLTAKIRFASGVVLVLLAISLVWLVLRSNQATEQYLITQSNLPTGTLLSQVGLGTVAVQLGQAQGAYLRSVPADAVLTRPLAAGELIAADAVATSQALGQRSVVLVPATALSAEVKPGSKVEVWVSPKLEQGHAPAFILVSDAEIVEIRKPDEMFASSNSAVEISVRAESVALLLDAIAAEGDISVIAVN